eukprot:1496094-Rhodomonas_salina.1
MLSHALAPPSRCRERTRRLGARLGRRTEALTAGGCAAWEGPVLCALAAVTLPLTLDALVPLLLLRSQSSSCRIAQHHLMLCYAMPDLTHAYVSAPLLWLWTRSRPHTLPHGQAEPASFLDASRVSSAAVSASHL